MVGGSRAALLLVALSVAEIACNARHPAAAITVELAKKCRASMLKAHPYVLPGNKAAAGLAEAQRDYFNKCVANDGNMPTEPEKKNPAAKNPAENKPN
jgi:hypothetical protein